MNLLSVSKLSRSGRERPLFQNISFGLDEGQKAALIGKNGCGKSTLLSCIAGTLESDGGTVIVNKSAGLSWLPQQPVYRPEHSIREHIFAHESPKLSIIREYETLCDDIAHTTGAIATTLTERLDRVTAEMESRDLWNYENQIRSILTTLGITSLDAQMGTLSGGMAKKVALAQVLIEDTKLILLDEPTNHLDIETIAWLEEYLKETDRSVLMVTHDRYFLDAVCDSIYELEYGNLTLYEGNFSKYLEKKALEAEIAANTDSRIESVLRTEREWLLRGPKARGTKARARIDSIHGMMENLKLSKEQLASNKTWEFSVSGRRLGGKILEAEQVWKTWSGSDTPVIRDFSYTFKKGERIGIFGGNGSGKTTLLNLLCGALDCDKGIISKGENTVFAYYRQNPVIGDTSLTVLDYIREEAEYVDTADGGRIAASQFLEQFGFSGKMQYSPVTALSGGERKRLYLVRLLVSNPNFLVLDEPTNDFDIYTMSVLESFLEAFQGCLLVVSHDRYFMDRVADTLLVLEGDGSISGFTGSCSEYLASQKDREEALPPQIASPPRNETKRQATTPAEVKKTRRTFKEEREFEGIEAEIATLENRKSELETLMSAGGVDHTQLRALAAEFEQIAETLESRYARWEYLAALD